MFWIIFAVIGAAIGGGQMALGMAQLYPPFAALLARQGYAEHPDLIATVADLIQQRYKNLITDGEYFTTMSEAGYSNKVAAAMYDAAASYLTGYDYIQIWRRELIDDDTLKTNLNKIGYGDDQIENLKKATLYYPGPSDVVTFAVREVYKQNIVSKYGLDQEIDPEYIADAKRSGLSEDFARKYWMGHWVLPSAQMGYEMLHRGIIEDSELETLLGTLDYMPYWRDKLKAISYNVINRVDVRRMYQAGLIDRSKVLQTYHGEGYSPEDSELMTRFVEKTYAPKLTAQSGISYLYPTANDIIGAYKKGLITRETAFLELERPKVTATGTAELARETIDLMLAEADDELKQELIDIEADSITDNYRVGFITLEEYKIELTKLGVSSQYMETTIARELAQAKRRTKMPTKADYDKWLKINLLDEGGYRANLKILGYRDSDIDLYEAEIYYDGLTAEEKGQLTKG